MGLKRLWFCLVSAAAFFVTYDCTKSLLGAGGPLAAPHVAPVAHMLAASLGEIVSLSAPSPSRLLFNLGPSTLLLACLLTCLLASFLPYFCFLCVCFRVYVYWFHWSLCRVAFGGRACSVGCRLRSPAGGFLGTLITACWFAQLRPPDASNRVCGIQTCDQQRRSLLNPSHPNHSRVQILSHMGATGIHTKQEAPCLYHRGFLQNTGLSVFMDFGWM